MTDTAEYITLLVISVAVTIAVGRVLSVSGEPFLQEVFEDEKVTVQGKNVTARYEAAQTDEAAIRERLALAGFPAA